MKVLDTPIDGLVLIQPPVFGDHRGYFLESYNSDTFRSVGIDAEFVQDNESCSSAGVLRGLHFQHPPHAQGKLVRVIRGSVWDVAVDIRKDSPTYGAHFGVELSGDNKLQLWIPPGFAHGFYTLEDDTIFAYKCSALYHKASEEAILWNDADLQINWPSQGTPLVSEKDEQATPFSRFTTPF